MSDGIQTDKQTRLDLLKIANEHVTEWGIDTLISSTTKLWEFVENGPKQEAVSYIEEKINPLDSQEKKKGDDEDALLRSFQDELHFKTFPKKDQIFEIEKEKINEVEATLAVKPLVINTLLDIYEINKLDKTKHRPWKTTYNFPINSEPLEKMISPEEQLTLKYMSRASKPISALNLPLDGYTGLMGFNGFETKGSNDCILIYESEIRSGKSLIDNNKKDLESAQEEKKENAKFLLNLTKEDWEQSGKGVPTKEELDEIRSDIIATLPDSVEAPTSCNGNSNNCGCIASNSPSVDVDWDKFRNSNITLDKRIKAVDDLMATLQEKEKEQ